MQDRFKFRVWLEYAKLYYGLDSFYYDRLKNKYTLHFEDGYTKTIKEKDCVIEQCTGLKDKNGKLIYEGDIVIKDKHEFEVYYDDSLYGYYLRSNNIITVFVSSTKLEIIGNIHENGDLLK